MIKVCVPRAAVAWRPDRAEVISSITHYVTLSHVVGPVGVCRRDAVRA